MVQYQILYWKDIPAQIKVYEGRRAVSRQLPERFQIEIDRIAMKEGLAGTDDYLDQWQWSPKKDRPPKWEIPKCLRRCPLRQCPWPKKLLSFGKYSQAFLLHFAAFLFHQLQ